MQHTNKKIQGCGGMADTPDLGSGVERHTSSSLVSPTIINRAMILLVIATIAIGHAFKGPAHMWMSTAVLIVYTVMTEILFMRQRKLLEHLQEFHHICAWCKKVHYNGEYIPVETYLKLKTHLESSHGICEDCKNNVMRDLSLFGNVL